MKKMVLLCLGLLLMPLAASATSLKLENYAEVLVNNLQIGNTYSMTQLVNLPLKVSNDSAKPIVVELTSQIPQGKQIKPDFEPIPDAAWVSFQHAEITVPAHGQAETDVQIKIPDEKKYFGKKFHAAIYARVAPPKNVPVGVTIKVEGRLLFTIAPVKKTVAPPAADLKYSISSNRLEVKNAPLGKKVEILGADKKPLKIINESKETKKFFIFSLNPKETVLSIEPGAEACPSPDNLTLETDSLEISGGGEKTLPMFVEIPDKPEYRAKRFEFVVSVEMGERGLTQRYVRVFVETAK